MVKAENQTYKIIGRTFAVLLSILLVIALIVASVVTAARSLLRTEMVIDVAKNYADEKFVPTDENFGDIFNHVADDKQFVNDMLESNTFKDVLDLYLEDTTDALAGKDFTERFTAERVDEIFRKHREELTDIVARNGRIPDEEAAWLVDELIEERLPEIVESVPKPAALATEANESLAESGVQLQVFYSGAILWILWGTVAALAILILLCRLFRFRALKWLGIDAMIAAFSLLPVALVLRSSLLPRTPVLVPIYIQLSHSILLTAGLLTAAGVLLIGVNIALHFVFRRAIDEGPQPDPSQPWEA